MTITEIAPSGVQTSSAELIGSRRGRTIAETVALRTRPLSPTLIEVSAGGAVIGFLELDGGLWVALYGPYYSWAAEVGRKVDPDQAVLTLFAHGAVPVSPTGVTRGGPRNREKGTLCL